MRTTYITRAAAAAVLAAGVASCAGPGAETPEPTTGSETSPSATKSPFSISQPKDLAAISDPCRLLTPQQVQQLGAGEPQPDGKSPWGQAQCLWDSQKLAISVSPDTVQGQGIRTAAFNNSESGKPTHRVRGYPAVHSYPSDISCGTFVGTSKTDVVSVSFTVGSAGRGAPEYADPCAMSDKIAGMVLENLPPA
ncbi:DUF3558 domain-containing protein [Haloactinomyces albus]|uniref:DUF3558 domain-containing protein n=1 Tax=Haloactinomyces albus TaxID=1352928 RepID=A0AAE3ZG12_9ACTN|nr:DUF3558 domain-containing protein [Haloactinomyces albus]MDR7302854.1 hypothetical protein [Haloactinomyces albus]